MDATQARNLGLVTLLGCAATVITYLSFEQFPALSLSGSYLTLNVGLVFLFVGAAVAMWRWTQQYWYEIAVAFLAAYAATSVLVFGLLEYGGVLVAGAVGVAVAGGLLTYGLSQYLSPVVGYQFTLVLLTLVFAFVLVYVTASVVETGDPNLVPPLFIAGGVFVVAAYGLREELDERSP